MKHLHGRMDERILVCVYYGPNGERLINRGHKIAKMLDCPLYILTVDSLPYAELDAEKLEYIERWKELCEEYNVEEFIIRDRENKPIQHVIAEVANHLNITQVIIGQTAQSRWEEITKGSFMNLLLKELPFVDMHVVSVERFVQNKDTIYEKGVRAYLVQEAKDYKVSFTCPKEFYHSGIFFKEIGTDFDNGIFKFMHKNKMHEVQISDNVVTKPSELPE
ncbi:universal stress protein [Rummeliibacillus sp. JY-2-4R]